MPRKAFLLGSAAILGNVGMLRLYPGLSGRAGTEAPILRNRLSTAHASGLLLGPRLLRGLRTRLGWPLVALPLLAAPVQRRFARFLTRRR
jgi:hypothetical protein